MTRKQGAFLSIAVVLLFSLLFFIIFGEHGLIDLNTLKNERDQLAEKSEQLTRKNLSQEKPKRGARALRRYTAGNAALA